MTHPDDVQRLREIKRLLERIQRLPRIAAMPANGLMDGPARGLSGSMTGPAGGLDAALHDAPANGLRNGHDMRPFGAQADRRPAPPHPAAEPDLEPEPEDDRAGLTEFDPLPPPFGRVRADSGQSDYWAADDGTDDPEEAPAAGSRALVPARASARGGVGLSPWVFVVATAVNTIVAAALAVVITLGLERREPEETAKLAAAVKPAVEGRSQAGEVPAPLELLPVGSRKEPLRLEAMKPARLPFVVRPGEAAQESFILVLTGLPAKATLSGASRIGTDTWHLPPGALARLKIVVPEWSAAVHEVAVELRRTNGVLAAQAKLWLAVPPPPAPTSGASLDEAALKDMVHTGDQLLKRGDVVAARAMYEKAAAMGSAPAALAMGTTYDPRRLWALGVFGMVGNKDRARQWYERAAELGHPDAKARIRALQ